MLKRLTFFNISTIFILISLSFVIVAITLRLIYFTEVLQYLPDQAADLLVAHKILFENHRPLVGPFLSVQHFYTPPYYYYILALFLYIGKTIVGTTMCFLLLNLLCGVLFYSIGKMLFDKWYGLFMFGLYAVSSEMVHQSQSIWQPHVLLFPLLLSMYCMFRYQSKKQFFLVVMGIFLYVFSLSMYPSPIILLPYYLTLSYREIQKTMQRTQLLHALLPYVGVWLLSFAVVYAPQVLFEISSDFPTFRSLSGSAFGFRSIGTTALLSMLTMLNTVFRIDEVFNGAIGLVGCFIAVLLVILFVVSKMNLDRLPQSAKARYNRTISIVFTYPLLLGLIFILYFQNQIFAHRLLAIYPFIILGLALPFRLSLESKVYYLRQLVVVVGFFYVAMNIVSVYYRVIYRDNDIAAYYNIYTHIISDVTVKNYTIRDISLRIISTGTSYYLSAPLLYLFHSLNQYPVDLAQNNDIVPESRGSIKQYYLICDGNNSDKDFLFSCFSDFAHEHVGVRPVDTIAFTKRKTLFVFE